MYVSRVAEALPRIRGEIHAAAERSGRSGEQVRLVAVTKGHPVEAVHAALGSGIRDLGENRVGELAEKVAAVGRDAAVWHMIGHLQRRKAPDLVGICDLLHSVDGLRLAERLSRFVPEGSALPVLLQVNTSGEESKGGFSPDEALEAVHQVMGLPGLRVEGLMTMAPFVDEEGVLRRAFADLRELRERARKLTGYCGRELSMGMTNDYTIAVEEGSTMVRLGTAIFGERIACST